MNEKNYELFYSLIEERKYHTLKTMLAEMNEADIAAFIEEIPPDKSTIVFRTLPKELAAEVFAYMNPDMQQHIIATITDREIAAIIEDLFVDDAVDLLEELPANVVKRVLKNATNDTRALINQFLQYPENSAGSIMTAEFVDLRKSMKVKDAILRIRRTGVDKETIYVCYVTDENRYLEGVLSIKTLLLSNDEEIIEDIMDTNIIFVNTATDREDAAAIFSKYSFVSIPVVDNEKRLVGIVTVDDAVDVIEQEATEDFEKMAAMLPSEKPYLKTSVLELSKNRIAWLLVLMFSATVTGSVIGRYEEVFLLFPFLYHNVPMLTDTGGNAGAQSSTLVIRGMALKEIRITDFFKVFWKEFRVSILVGAVLSIANYIRLIIMYPDKKLASLTVVLSLFATVVVAKTIGGLLPMGAKMIKADPALMASPIITTVVDAVSLIIYVNIAKAILGI